MRGTKCLLRTQVTFSWYCWWCSQSACQIWSTPVWYSDSSAIVKANGWSLLSWFASVKTVVVCRTSLRSLASSSYSTTVCQRAGHACLATLIFHNVVTSVATRLRCGDVVSVMITLLQIYCWVCCSKRPPKICQLVKISLRCLRLTVYMYNVHTVGQKDTKFLLL